MTKFVKVLIRLVCLLTVLNGYGQENQWLKGTWSGVYFGEKSKLTKTFDTRLQITKVNGSSFEGTVQCILPSDTTIRLHTRITGRIYPHHIMTKLKEVTYFKDPPYTPANRCFWYSGQRYYTGYRIFFRPVSPRCRPPFQRCISCCRINYNVWPRCIGPADL